MLTAKVPKILGYLCEEMRFGPAQFAPNCWNVVHLQKNATVYLFRGDILQKNPQGVPDN